MSSFVTAPYALACAGQDSCDGGCVSSSVEISASTACSAQAQSCGEPPLAVGMSGVES